MRRVLVALGVVLTTAAIVYVASPYPASAAVPHPNGVCYPGRAVCKVSSLIPN